MVRQCLPGFIIKLRMTRQDLCICIVDTDYGCAVIQKRPSSPLTPPTGLGFEDLIRWEYFSQNRKRLLDLISTSEFLERYPYRRNHRGFWQNLKSRLTGSA